MDEARSLAAVLTSFTRTPQTCFFGLWEGWARAAFSTGPAFESSGRVMTLWEGAVADAAASFEAPPGERVANLWWPQDHAWFVVTEIDFDSTIVAGSRECITAVVSAPGLEAIEIRADLDLSSPL